MLDRDGQLVWQGTVDIEPRRKPGPIAEAACWAHGRREFYVLADVAKAPIAFDAVCRTNTTSDVERDVNGRSPEQRLAARAEHVRPLVDV